MFDKPRPRWQSMLLHLILITCSVVFALPFVWLVGTSWKLDREVQSDTVRILPSAPRPRLESPYLDDEAFSLERPDDIGRHRWDQWMREAIIDEVNAAIGEWRNPRAQRMPLGEAAAEAANMALVAGVFQRLRGVLPPETWSAEQGAFRRMLRDAIKPAYFTEAFDTAYRYLALGKVLLKDEQYRIHDLTGLTPADQVWSVTRGSARLEPRMESGRPIAALSYDWTTSAEDSFEVSATFAMPVEINQLKRLDVSFRRDGSWHELRAVLEVDGVQYRSASPRYLGEDTWWDVQFQMPSKDDDRLIPRHYILLNEVARGPEFDPGKGNMRLRLRIQKSGTPEAYWAKGTENYRKVFAEVPFWRYLRNSVFLAILNILGTCVSCALTAYALARLEWPGRQLSFVLVLATLMIPPQITMIPSFVIYKYLGWYNSLAPLWVPSCLAVNAFAVFLLRQAMRGIPRELEDAAKIDGCGFLRTWWHVAMPAMRPTLAAISIFTFMYVWNDFMGPLIYVNDQRLYPLALGLFSFMAGRENQFTLIMAGAMIMTIPVVVTFFLAQRYFIQGVTLTGLKG